MNKPHKPGMTPSADPVFGKPEDVWELTRKYGTFEVQDTTDTENAFPCIGPTSGNTAAEIPPEDVKKQQ